MSWLWLELRTEAPPGTLATVPVADADGSGGGVLAFFPGDRDARPGTALRVDGRLLPSGEPKTAGTTWISWCRMDDPDHSLAFDDGAVTGAIRRCLAQPWSGAVSTLLVDWSRIAGAITASADQRAAAADPFAGVFPRRLLRADGVALGAIDAPTGPCVTRYGSGNPWPWDRYAGQAP